MVFLGECIYTFALIISTSGITVLFLIRRKMKTLFIFYHQFVHYAKQPFLRIKSRTNRTFYENVERAQVNSVCVHTLTFYTNIVKLPARCSPRHLVHFVPCYYRMKIRLGNFPVAMLFVQSAFSVLRVRLSARMNRVR